MQLPKLVADLDLGLAADLLPDARPGRAEAKIYRPDQAQFSAYLTVPSVAKVMIP
jgi:hypothetical protein